MDVDTEECVVQCVNRGCMGGCEGAWGGVLAVWWGSAVEYHWEGVHWR